MFACFGDGRRVGDLPEHSAVLVKGTQVEVHVAAYTFERFDARLSQVASLGCCLERATGQCVQGIHAASCLQHLCGDRQIVGAGCGGKGDRRHEFACWLCTPAACEGFAGCLFRPACLAAAGR